MARGLQKLLRRSSIIAAGSQRLGSGFHESGQKAETARAKWLAWGSLATWVGLIIAGRLLEYTHKWELLGVRALT